MPKFTVMLKSPEALSELQTQHRKYEQLNDEYQNDDSKTQEEKDHVKEHYDEACQMLYLAEKFFKYDEILTVEFDTEKQTATVLKK